MASFRARPIPDDLRDRWIADGLWRDESLGSMLAGGLDAHPDMEFVVHSDERPWSGTYADVHRMALAAAGGLRARGIGPGDAVAFQLPNWVEAAVTFYAAAFLGAVVVPIVHFYGPKEVGYILGRSDVRAFVTGRRFGLIDFTATLDALSDQLDDVLVAVVDAPTDNAAADNATAVRGTIGFDELLQGPPIDGPVELDPDAPALVAYTSGTTSDPKGVVHSHRTIGCETRQLSAQQSPDAPPSLIGLPVGHAMGMLGALLMPVPQGKPVHLIDVWDPAKVLATMGERGLSSGGGAAYFLLSLLDHPDITDEHRHLMRFVGLGGSSVPEAVTRRATDEGISVVRMYGSTEHPSITGGTHDQPLDKRISTDGAPLAGVEIRLVDELGRPVPVGEPGEILSRGPDCCIGYSDPALTAAAFDDDGWFRTEDVGVLDDDGYLRITDRKKDVIIRGGENISAVEVEDVLQRMAGVAEVAVVAAPDDRFGERVCAIVRTLPDAERPDLDALRAAAADAGLARPKWPEQVVIVDDLPRTPSGKVKKAELRQRLRDGEL